MKKTKTKTNKQNKTKEKKQTNKQPEVYPGAREV
jgi:hypothetical protein